MKAKRGETTWSGIIRGNHDIMLTSAFGIHRPARASDKMSWQDQYNAAFDRLGAVELRFPRKVVERSCHGPSYWFQEQDLHNPSLAPVVFFRPPPARTGWRGFKSKRPHFIVYGVVYRLVSVKECEIRNTERADGKFGSLYMGKFCPSKPPGHWITHSNAEFIAFVVVETSVPDGFVEETIRLLAEGKTEYVQT